MLPVAAIFILIFVPLVLLMKFLTAIGLRPDDRDRTPAELAVDLRAMADGTEEPWAWDDLECVPMRDKRLEIIRLQALHTSTPLTDDDRIKLRRLADEAAALPSL
jgi:hypothetical protein